MTDIPTNKNDDTQGTKRPPILDITGLSNKETNGNIRNVTKKLRRSSEHFGTFCFVLFRLILFW
jgi:hypothetical protein